MLVLARKQNQNIMIGNDIVIKVVWMERNTVKIGIQAPTTVPVHRQEIYDEIHQSNQAALTTGPGTAPKLRAEK
jgi:carbon storage regulator